MAMPAPSRAARVRTDTSFALMLPLTGTSTVSPSRSKRHRLLPKYEWVRQLRRDRSSMRAGTPSRSRYSGEAQTTERQTASLRAIRLGSRSLVMRTARSTRSSTRLTARSTSIKSTDVPGCRFTYSVIAPARWREPNDMLVVMRNKPRGVSSGVATALRRSPTMSSICRQRGNVSAPAGVRLRRRVVRCSKRTPTHCSISAR
ncbi:hypothetical protein FQZ97_864810 [compost metagenome]